MVDSTQVRVATAPTDKSHEKVKKHIKITEINYRRNTDSDYTEKIQKLDKNFSYDRDSQHYWSNPELSLFYGTPLYEQASSAQKLALNHLYWATQYNQTAATEANTVLYNQVTGGVFAAVGGYGTLCQELDLETDQERHHIHAFHTISYKTKKALLGQAAFNAPGKSKGIKNGAAKSGQKSQLFSFDGRFDGHSESIAEFRDSTFRFITNKVMLKHQANYYSHYLQQLDQKGELIPAQTTGLLGQIAPRSFLQFFTLNCGSSPFLACMFYLTRFMANMLLKNYEYDYVQYHRELEKKGEFIPAATAVSLNHLLDESFHTTTSQLIALEVYRDFPNPTAYEKLVANTTIYRAQKVGLSGLSGAIPGICRSDDAFMMPLYKLLQSPVFDLSAPEALQWMETGLCQEHQGFHVNLQYHQRLLAELQRMFEGIDYLWGVNREMQLMASGGSVNTAIAQNSKAFARFSRSLAQSD
ncbi:hypothetical protein [Myxacorys almedinensis]|uniref:Uncharacterized protein n=1 Tax=Myxacorys almedinensis A TaxID=2690445 RepID=A0A8J8CPF6_9CYAN|nr:hypothetical protein [Myxacorys almedinensis]NDJ19427.1 hypothetical protein [Myxacorys almedinensis A]